MRDPLKIYATTFWVPGKLCKPPDHPWLGHHAAIFRSKFKGREVLGH